MAERALKKRLGKRKRKDLRPQSKSIPNKEDGEKDAKVKKWTNKQRVLVFCQRGINFRARHLMLDLRSLMPHSRSDNKLDRKDNLQSINEISEMKNCNKCIFFNMKRKKDLYMWISCIPYGPSAKFLVENVHTMDELKLTGNCLKGSRPVLSFDKTFEEVPHYKLLKEVLTQTFATPNLHPKSKPFIDHIFNFSVKDNRIWFRNYQIINENDMSLTEIGPRFVLNPIKIFNGSFGGATLFKNPHYISPTQHRRQIRQQASMRYLNKKESKQKFRAKVDTQVLPSDELEDIFHTVTQADLKAMRQKETAS